MKSTIPFLLVLIGMALISPSLAQTQDGNVLSDTTFGKSQNDERDLVNSLIPAEEKFGHGEKKSQINTAELKSKTMKDSTFGGSLLNMGIDPSEPKIDESKLRNAPAEVDKKSAAAKQQTAATEQKSTAVATEPARTESAAVEKAPEDAAAASPESQQTFSNLSMTATLGDALIQEDKAAAEARTSSNSGDIHNKDQSAGDKSSTATATDKSSDPKPNGDH